MRVSHICLPQVGHGGRSTKSDCGAVFSEFLMRSRILGGSSIVSQSPTPEIVAAIKQGYTRSVLDVWSKQNNSRVHFLDVGLRRACLFSNLWNVAARLTFALRQGKEINGEYDASRYRPCGHFTGVRPCGLRRVCCRQWQILPERAGNDDELHLPDHGVLR
jgi:hypothetical protein